MTARKSDNAEATRQLADETEQEYLAQQAADQAATDDGWEIRQDEAPDRLIFDTIGDEYIGLYLGIVTITPEDPEEETFEQALFWDEESPKAINLGFKLLQALKHVGVGEEARIKYVKNIDVKQASAMKDFKVWARPARDAWQWRAKQAIIAAEWRAREANLTAERQA